MPAGLAITTALTLRAVSRLALRQTGGVTGSILALRGLDPAAPGHTTLSRRAEALEVPRPLCGRGPLHLLVDRTGLKLCGPGEWLVKKHGSRRRRGWRKLHLATDTGTDHIIASVLTDKDVDDGSRVGPLLDHVDGPVTSFTTDGAKRKHHDRLFANRLSARRSAMRPRVADTLGGHRACMLL